MQQWITMTASDATINVIIRIKKISFLKPLLEAFKLIYILKVTLLMKE